jgi:hypothetical protein
LYTCSLLVYLQLKLQFYKVRRAHFLRFLRRRRFLGPHIS